jgi:hypothetical protein
MSNLTDLKYVCGVTGNIYDLNRRPFALDPEGMYDWKWSYTTSTVGKWNQISQFTKDINESSHELVVYSARDIDIGLIMSELANDCEKDIRSLTPGKLINGNGWYIPCYINGMESKYWQKHKGGLSCNITIVAEKPFWRYEQDITVYKNAQSESSQAGCKTYPYNYMYDYFVNVGSRWIETGDGSTYYRLVIPGYVNSPQIYIKDLNISVNVIVPEGGFLTIDSEKKTIILTDAAGAKTNCFGLRDFDNYIFDGIDAGSVWISYDGTYDFTLTLIKERSAPWGSNMI